MVASALNTQSDVGAGRIRAYRLALGEFVDVFAKVEIFVHMTLSHYARTTHSISTAVFSGVRIDTATSFLRRLSDNGNISKSAWDELEPVLAQLKIIGDRRNQLLHHGADGIEEGSGQVTNAVLAHIKERITTFQISPDILRRMTFDLRKSLIHLYARHMGVDDFSEAERVEMDDLLSAPWRYIPEPQPRKPTGGKGRSRREKRHQ